MTSGELTETGRPADGVAAETTGMAQRRSGAEIQQWLTEYLAFLLDQKPDAVNVQLTFEGHGIDSAAAVSLVADLEDWLGMELDPTIVYDYPNVPELARFLVGRQGRGTA